VLLSEWLLCRFVGCRFHQIYWLRELWPCIVYAYISGKISHPYTDTMMWVVNWLFWCKHVTNVESTIAFLMTRPQTEQPDVTVWWPRRPQHLFQKQSPGQIPPQTKFYSLLIISIIWFLLCIVWYGAAVTNVCLFICLSVTFLDHISTVTVMDIWVLA